MTTTFKPAATKTVGVNAMNFEFTFTRLERIACSTPCSTRRPMCARTLEITMEDGASMHMIESGAMVALLADDCKD